MKVLVTGFAVVLFLLTKSIAGQVPSKRFLGVVDDQHGAHVSHASVICDCAKAPTETDDNGLFVLDLRSTIAEGQYVSIHVQKNGYRPLSMNVWYPNPFYYEFTLTTLGLQAKQPPATRSPRTCSHDGQVSSFHDELKKYGLPPDLYDRECQLASLTIRQVAVADLDWLDSAPLSEFTIASPELTSIDGLARISRLRSLSLDLNNAPLMSLDAISTHRELHTLVLRNIKNRVFPPIADFPNLKSLELDFQRSSISSLPDLTACPELHDVVFNLRATNSLFGVPNLSGFSYLQSVTLLLDNSAVRTLKPLAAIDNLPTLKLTLDGTQLSLLSDLNGGPGPQFLSLFVTSPLKDPFPDLSGIHNLIGLTLQMPGPRGPDLPDTTPVPDITYLHNLQALTLSLKTSAVQAVPDIGRLTNLQILDLDLQESSVQRLPSISGLHDLVQLTLNLNGTTIPELPNFAQLASGLARLKELNLLLASSQIHSLQGIDHLAALSSLGLDVRGIKIKDLGAIAKIANLQSLSLRMQWSQLADLPDLRLLKRVINLELHLDGFWPNEELPPLPPNLQKLTLILEKSAVRDLSSLQRVSKLEELQLDLQGAEIRVLPDLRGLKKLRLVEADIRHSRILANQTGHLAKLQNLTIDRSTLSLEDLPATVKALSIAP